MVTAIYFLNLENVNKQVNISWPLIIDLYFKFKLHQNHIIKYWNTKCYFIHDRKRDALKEKKMKGKFRIENNFFFRG